MKKPEEVRVHMSAHLTPPRFQNTIHRAREATYEKYDRDEGSTDYHCAECRVLWNEAR
jgi:hypothetical protein